MKQYNDKYKNVWYEGKSWRLYNENTTTSLDALYSEIQIKLIELVEKYNFKIFYFTCQPATFNKLNVDSNGFIDLETENVKKIKENQSKDFYFLYKNQICEVFYSFLKLDKNKNYYFDFMVVVNDNFKLNDLYLHKFKTVKIINVSEINLKDITFDFIQSIYKKRIFTVNNCAPINDKNFYNLNELEYDYKDFSNNYKNGSMDFDYEEYANYNSFYFYSKYNQDLYAKNLFKLLSSQIWSLDSYFYKEKNKYGLRLTYKEKYDLNSSFLTNFAELVGCINVELKNDNVILNHEYYSYSCLSDNISDQSLILTSFNIEYLQNKKINFNNLKIENKYE